jgi:hypothetical protein
MTSLYPTSSENTPSDEWDIYFYNQFEGPERLNTKLIRGLVARICSSNAMMMRRIKRRSIRTPYLDIISVLKYDKVTEDLKYVASNDEEVRELIVGFVRNRESILGEARKKVPTMEEESIIAVDEDGRVPMVSRARTFKEIVAEIGTSRSRRVRRAMQRVEEGRPFAAGDEDGVKGSVKGSDEQSDTGLEVLVMENQGKVWASTTNVNQADKSQNGRNTQGSRTRPANWLERLQNGSSGTIKTPPAGSSDSRNQARAGSVPLQKGHHNQEMVPCSRAKSAGETDGNDYPALFVTEDSLVLKECSGCSGCQSKPNDQEL